MPGLERDTKATSVEVVSEPSGALVGVSVSAETDQEHPLSLAEREEEFASQKSVCLFCCW